jgi:hypothetical protein
MTFNPTHPEPPMPSLDEAEDGEGPAPPSFKGERILALSVSIEEASGQQELDCLDFY